MKRQLKKSLSLFLAVLMMFSCWVWVAPEKAEAALEKYTVTISGTVGNAVDNENLIYFSPTADDKNWGNAITFSSVKDVNDNTPFEQSFSVDFWPAAIRFYFTTNFMTKHTVTVNKIDINGVVIFNDTYSISKGSASDGKSDEKLYYNGSWGSWNFKEKGVWTAPVFKKHTGVSATEVTVNKLPNGSSVTSTVTPTGGEDQYGVNWTGAIPNSGFAYSLKYTDELGVQKSLTTTYGKIDGTGNSVTATFYDDIQTLFPNRATANVQVECTYNNDATSKKSTNIQLTFPKYNSTFYGNGGLIGDNDGAAKESVVYEGDNAKLYGATIGKQPAYASKPGFDFMGFYSSMNADATGNVAAFSGTKFENNVTKIDATGDSNWYAAWQASPITATFVTQDGQLIGSVTGRYSNYLTADNMYKDLSGLNAEVRASHTDGKIRFNGNNEPVYTDGSTEFTFDGWRIIEAYDESLLDMEIKGVAEDSKVILKGDVTFQAIYTKPDAKTYTVSFEDGNGNIIKDENGNDCTKSDYKYRDDVIVPSVTPEKATDDRYSYEFIGWAKDIGKAFYAVDEADRDENGAVIAYTHKDGAEFIVKGDASYVPVFRMIPRQYVVTYNYTGDNETDAVTTIEDYYWHDGVRMPDIKDNYTANGYRYFITGWRIGTDPTVRQLEDIAVEGDMTLTAVYGNSEAAEYTINFYGKDTDGETDILLNGDSNVYKHNAIVIEPEVPNQIDTEESLYVFAGWSPSVNVQANSDIDYYATYTKTDYADLHFYNYDGTLIYELDGKKEGLFVDGTIPYYENLVEVDGVMENVLPQKPEDAVGTYDFVGWKDANGNTVEPGVDVFSGDTFLTAQFETVYKRYTVEFVDGEDTVLKKTYKYGEEITVPADPEKEADAEYIYDFRSWTPDISTVCYDHATYEAVYRRTPQYYKVTWLKDDKSILSESNYTYNAKIQQATINSPADYPTADDGNTWVIDYWVLCNAAGEPVDEYGNIIYLDIPEKLLTDKTYGYAQKLADAYAAIDADESLNDEQKAAKKAAKKAIISHMAPIEYNEENVIKFERGQRMPAEHLYFYPVFKQETNVLTVHFYKEDGTSLLGAAKIPYGDNITDYADEFAVKAPKEPDAKNHYIIKDWVNVENGEVVTTITSDIAVKATYTAEEHNKVIYEVVAKPTCNVPGSAHYKCEAEECTAIDYNVALAPVPDEGVPTGQFYVGNDKWTLEDYKNGIDYSDIKFVGPNTYVVVNADDTGTRSMPWNVEGVLNRGIGKIEYYISENKVDNPAGIDAAEWKTVYNYEEYRQEALDTVLTANKVTLTDYMGYNHGTAEDRLKKAEIDRAVDELLSTYNANATGVLSNLSLVNGKTYIIYIKISDREGNGEVNVSYLSSGKISYGTEAPEITVVGEGYGTKHCIEATVMVSDDTDGFKVYLDGEEVALTNNKFVCETKGIHTVTVIDKNGNKATKTVEVVGSHSYRNYTIAATCEVAGSTYDVCTVCQATSNVKTNPAIGHSYTVNYIDKAPTCAVDGTRTYVCDHNCGTQHVLAFSKETGYLDPADLAKVQKWDETANGGAGAWVTLTAADLAHLKSTGEHTYEKIKDADGKDTIDDKWIIDTVATCKTEGSKHKDCTKCGLIGRVTETIPYDTENGHKFYREKVTQEPTCTEKGKKSRTCRYCGFIEVTKYLDPLGHTAGEYVTIKAPTCTEAGSEMLTCLRCQIHIGENGYNPDEAPVEKVIPALGHKWKLEGEPFEKDVVAEDGQVSKVYHQRYVCPVCKAIEDRPLDGYKPPVAATVTFDFNGGYYVIPAVGTEGSADYVAEKQEVTQIIDAMVGDSIIATDVEKAVKNSDKTYNYTFSHWATKDEFGNYTEVKFPIEVKGNETFYAVYAEKYINYEVTYYRENNTEFKVTGYHHNGDTVDFVDAPNKEGYKFLGWGMKVKVPGENGTVKEIIEIQDIVKINGENISLYAVYEKYPVYYIVTYAYSEAEEDVIERFNVIEGGIARDCGITPVKAPDQFGHYEFASWDKAADLVIVTESVYALPTFDTIAHNCEKDLKTAATCTTDAIYTYTCKDCGYTFDEVEKGSALDHMFGDWMTDENGNKYRECQREGCDAVETENATTYSITYYNADGSVYVVSTSVPENAPLKNYILRDGPAKDMDETYTYEFIGWASKEDVNSIPLTVTEDLELVPVYASTKRTYTVIFAYDGKNIIEEVEVKAGEKAECSEEVKKAYDSDNHYNFKTWSKADKLAAVYGDIYTTAEFEAEAHNAVKTNTVDATCYANAVETYTCECGYSYEKVVIGSAGHTWVDGVCDVCGVTTSGSAENYKLAYYTESGKAYRYSYNIPAGAKLADIVLTYGPEKTADKEKTYTFGSWLVYSKDENGKVTTEAITDSTVVASDVVLYPEYDETVRKYKVIFAYDAENVIAEGTVDAGMAATCATTPKKAADSKYHYEFDSWNRASELEEVYSDIYTTPIFEPVGHIFTKTEKAATCKADKEIVYSCTCGYSYTVKVPNSKVDHTWGAGVDNGQGKLVYTCTVCGTTKDDTATYKVEYYVDGNLVATEKDVAYGTKLSTLLDKKVTKDADDTNTYSFAGWLLDGMAPAADAEVKGNVRLDAEFKATQRTYIVIFAYDAQNVIEVVEVKAGEKAECTEEVEKAYDDEYHYTFKAWNKADELDAVYGNIYTTPQFNAVSHKYIEAITEATCTENKKITYTCECGHSYTETVAGTKGHKWTETTDAAGNKIKKCTACGETTTEGLKFTISYYVDNKLVSTKQNVEYGTKLADILSASKPGKDTDNYYVYAFKAWMIDGSVEVGDTVVTKDIALHAVYDRADRMYNVVFGYSASNTICTIENVKFGEISTSLYEKDTPTKNYDITYHYTFKGWKEPIVNNNTSTYLYYADFNSVKHDKYVDEAASKPATCTHGPSIVTKCTGCAYEELDQTGKPLPHTYELIEDKPASNGVDGKKVYKCKTCKDSYEEIIKWQDPESEYVTITVVVKESASGNPPVKNAKVDLYSGNTWLMSDYTNDNGIVKFKVPKGTYRAIVSGIQGAGTSEFTINAQKDGQTVESPKISIKHCGCACHNTSIWGKIFRFFHKIIKSFTGEFKCCADPSHLYN